MVGRPQNLPQITICGALMIACSALTALADIIESKPDYGDMVEWIVRLSWAEQNCAGNPSKGAKELERFIKSKLTVEFDDSDYDFQKQLREEQRLYKVESNGSQCSTVERDFGPKGWKLPDFWYVAPDRKAHTPDRPEYGSSTNTSSWGDLRKWAKDANHAHKICQRRITILAREIIDGIDAIFKGDASTLSRIASENPRYCPYLDARYAKREMLPELIRDETGKFASNPAAPADASPDPNRVDQGKSIFQHGDFVQTLTGEAVAPFQIKTAPGANYFFKLRNITSGDVLSGFLSGGRTLATKVPLGSYELKYAAGQEWIDENDYFGERTSFAIAKKTLVFEATDTGFQGVEVDLMLVPKGNLRTGRLSKKEF